ncbi:MAG: M23 family metallopeptidase [Actinomycetota bacterium]
MPVIRTVITPAVLALALVFSVSTPSDTAVATSSSSNRASDEDSLSSLASVEWLWPVEGSPQIARPFQAPAHDYAAGHRGADLRAPVGTPVRSPAVGVVAFRGVVVDRPLLTIDHGRGLVTTYEPLDSSLPAGTSLDAGDPIGTVATGGHAAHGTLHLGVRWHGVYIDPMALFGGAPRAILLPCCR